MLMLSQRGCAKNRRLSLGVDDVLSGGKSLGESATPTSRSCQVCRLPGWRTVYVGNRQKARQKKTNTGLTRRSIRAVTDEMGYREEMTRLGSNRRRDPRLDCDNLATDADDGANLNSAPLK